MSIRKLQKKELQLGYIKNHNDQQKTILIEFDYNKELILTPKYDSYIDTYIKEDDLPLFQKRKKKVFLQNQEPTTNQSFEQMFSTTIKMNVQYVE